MKIIVTHTSPDWDAIGSVWLLRKFLPGWNEVNVEFVPAGGRKEGFAQVSSSFDTEKNNPVEKKGDVEVIHVDTGMGPLDHHQKYDTTISGVSLTWEYIKKQMADGRWQMEENDKIKTKIAAIDRIVKIIVEIDHFKEVFWAESDADYHDFSVLASLDGLKLMKPDQDMYYVEWGSEILDTLIHYFENKIWAEREILENGIKFDTKWGKAIAFETINDDVLKLAQKKGYMLTIRRDPRKGYIRIKARPTDERQRADNDVDLTRVYEKLKKIDSEATWYLHISKKMLLNGTPKNPKMIPTKLTLQQIVDIVKNV